LKRTGKLYVVLAINAMGPVEDPRLPDLLTNWNEVDGRMLSKIFSKEYRGKYPDTLTRNLVISFFCISWSGFKYNPVRRDLGWHTVYDHYTRVWGREIERFGDGVYWLYNHPAPSGAANEWGLDWLHNTHYLNVLNHRIIERGYFPSVVQVPTEDNQTSHFLEDWFPFDFGNRNADEINWDAPQTGGLRVKDLLKWDRAPKDWGYYHPSHRDHQVPGRMNRIIFRLLDIKSIVYNLTIEEIEKAFRRCLMGLDTVLAAYEHDYRERAETIIELYIKPIYELSQKYTEVEWHYTNALEAAHAVLGYKNNELPKFGFYRHSDGFRVEVSKELFGPMPYVTVYSPSEEVYRQIPVTKIGATAWKLPEVKILEEDVIGVASSDMYGNVGVERFVYEGREFRRAEERDLAF